MAAACYRGLPACDAGGAGTLRACGSSTAARCGRAEPGGIPVPAGRPGQGAGKLNAGARLFPAERDDWPAVFLALFSGQCAFKTFLLAVRAIAGGRAAYGALCRQYGIVGGGSGQLTAVRAGPRPRVAGPGTPGMSDRDLHDRAARGRLAGPVRAISLMLTLVI